MLQTCLIILFITFKIKLSQIWQNALYQYSDIYKLTENQPGNLNQKILIKNFSSYSTVNSGTKPDYIE